MHPTRKLISINEPIEFKIYVKGAINVCLIDEFYNLSSLKFKKIFTLFVFKGKNMRIKCNNALHFQI